MLAALITGFVCLLAGALCGGYFGYLVGRHEGKEEIRKKILARVAPWGGNVIP